jgi:hypothetical protein
MNEFYKKSDSPDFKTRLRMWNSVRREIRKEKQSYYGLDFRSFSLGMAAAVILFFSFIGIRSTVLNFIESKRPLDERINRVYDETIDKLENKLPMVLSGKKKSVNVDDLIEVQLEGLESINDAIVDLKLNQDSYNQSPVKQRRLRELYKMKLEIINAIIAIEENER